MLLYKEKSNPVILSVIILYALVPILSEEINRFFLFIIFPILFLYYIIKESTFSVKNTAFMFFTLYFLFSIISITYAIDKTLSLNYLQFHLGVYIVAFLFHRFSENNKYTTALYWSYLIYLLSCLIQGFTQYGFAEVDITSGRAGGEGLNANRFGYFVFISTFIFYLWSETKKNRIYSVLFLLMIPASLYISVLSATRQILIIQIPFIAILLFKKYFSRINTKTIIVIALSCILVSIIGKYVMDYIESSFLYERFNRDVGDETRTKLINIAIELGNNNFFLGVGLANFRLFSGGFISHCSYTEAYAEGGIIQLILFMAVYVKIIYNQIKRYRITKDKVFITYLIATIFYAIYNIFYVFQSFGILIAFIFVLENDSKFRFRNICSSNYQ